MSALATPARSGLAGRLGAVNGRLAALLLALLALFGVLLGERLFNGASLRSMAYQLPELGILSLAMMVPLLSGGLDLSIIAVANLSALTMAFLFGALVPAEPGLAWGAAQALAVFGGFAVAGAIGAVNGAVVAYLGVSPILTTLGSMTLLKGVSIGLTHGGVLSGFPSPIVYIGNGSALGVPVVMAIFAASAALLALILNRTPFGHILHMLGSNEPATRYSGVDTPRVIVGVYAASGLLAALAGLVMMARFNSANASYGESYLLVTILAAVLGGVSPSGGFGRVAGLVIALVILQLISTAFNLLGFSQFLTLAIWGGTLIAVAAAARLREFLGFL